MNLQAYNKATIREARLRKVAETAGADRAIALANLHRAGWSYGEIAKETGISRSRVQQLVERGRAAAYED